MRVCLSNVDKVKGYGEALGLAVTRSHSQSCRDREGISVTGTQRERSVGEWVQVRAVVGDPTTARERSLT